MVQNHQNADLGRGLRWVQGEINQSLERVRNSLAAVLDDGAEPATLSTSVGEMRQVASVCSVARCLGGQLLAYQMAQCLGHGAAKPSASIENLLGEMVAASYQLEKYVGVVVGGIPDHPLAPLETVNTLRAALGQDPYSPAAALATSWRISSSIKPPEASAVRSDEALAARAAKHLPVLKQSLALILQNPKHVKAWQIQAQAAGQFAAVATGVKSHALWRLAKGVATVGPRLPDSARAQVGDLLKKQLGLLPHYGRAKVDALEATAAKTLAGWVLLLLKLDRKGSLASSLLTPIGLQRDDLVPQRLEVINEAMARPAEDSLVAVLRALQQDLATVKDDIESLQRDAGRPNEAVDETSQRFKVLSSSARGLGDEDLAESIRALGKHFVQLSKSAPDDPGWAELAVGLIHVEQSLSSGLLGSRAQTQEAASPMTADAQSSTLRECLINLARVKNEVDALLAHGRSEHAQSAIEQVRELSGALQIFGDQKLQHPFKMLQEFMAQQDFATVMQQPAALTAFADAIASAEYLLEALRDADPGVTAEKERLTGYVELLCEFDVNTAALAAEAPAAVETEVPAADEVDDELREIFLEEAGEVLEALQKHLPSWAQADNAEDMLELRRAFHTLKGSGRMVGAADIAEFGWAIENVLNRCRDGDLTRTPDLVALITDGVAALPEIIECFRDGRSAAERIKPTTQAANRLLGVADESGADDELQRVFLQDAETSMATLEAFDPLFVPNADVIAAWHGLRGSAAAAGVDALAELSGAAEHLCAQAALVQKALPDNLAGRASQQMREGLTTLASGSAVTVDAQIIQDLRRAAEGMLEPSTGADDFDPELRLIFCGEAQDLLESADSLLADASTDRADPDRANELQRVFHTIKGSARMAGAEGLGELGVLLDARAKHLVSEGGLLDAAGLKYFRVGTAAAWKMVDAFQSGRDQAAPDMDALVASAADEPAADTSTAEPAESAEPIRSTPRVAPLPEPVVEAPAPAAAAVEDDVDPELLEIFLPECDELLDDLDAGLQQVARDAQPEEALDALFRALHTLKGGARMAGLLGMGDSAHELETYVEKLRTSKANVDDEVRRRLQSGTDVLRGQREAVVAPDPAAVAAATEEGAAEASTDAEVVSRTGDTARVPVTRLDGMLTDVGEISMFRSRLEQQLVGLSGQLREFDQTIERLRDQVRNLESATDAQIQARASGLRHEHDEGDRYEEEFDPLEMDRYTRMQELTRSVTETISDLGSLHRTMREAVGESEAMVLQQGRLSTMMQEGLLTTLAVPFSQQQGRLARVVRQAATDEGKSARLEVEGGETELDRNVLERIVPALEHILRNSVVHGVESPADRQSANKQEEGLILISLRRDSNRIVLEITDDGGGLNHERIGEEAVKRGLMAAGTELSDDRIAQFIFEPGFSTAKTVSLTAGRGVGMDVVAAEVRQLGGAIDVGSTRGKGSRFTIRLPFSLAITQALQVQAGGEDFVVPLASIAGVARVPSADLARAQKSGEGFRYSNVDYDVKLLGELLGSGADVDHQGYLPVLFVRTGGDSDQGRAFAVVVDHLLGTREVVAKSVGRQVAAVPGIGGASIQPDGRVVLILDLADLILDLERRGLRGAVQETETSTAISPLVMVIDDSITMRRVAERILTRSGYRVALAKDGADGVALLQTTRPDAVLLDIEMPRMDGFEVASFIRHDETLREVPIIMITSRSGEKHRSRAANLGVNGYLIKPYQERELLAELESQLAEPQPMQADA